VSLGITEHPSRDDGVDCAVLLVVEISLYPKIIADTFWCD
jgi:hypothetical protein